MTTTAEPPSPREDVRDLDRAGVLDAVAGSRRAADLEEARILALAVQWVDLHPVVPGELSAMFEVGHVRLPSLPGEADRFRVVSLAGEGTPVVSELAVTELAATLGLSYGAGLALVSEAVELCFRLPRLWKLVQEGRLQAWKARKVAHRTMDLSREAVDFVDRHLAVSGAHGKIAHVSSVVHEARCQCDPDQAAAVEQAALDARGVHLDHRESTATTTVLATLDTLDALDLDASLSELATTMGRLGDDRDLDVRRASALGMLAHPQRVLDLLRGGRDGLDDPREVTVDRPIGSRATLYLHVDAADRAADHAAGLAGDTGGDRGCGRVEKLGAATLRLLQDWLARTDHVTIRPVLDLGRTDAVDRHDPPRWMRELVTLRDPHCVFPGCSVDSRACDLDHIEAYVDPDDGGPPGQTRPEGLAPLCRRHHRSKTFGGWTYRRLPEQGDDPDAAGPATSYAWTSPSRRAFRVVTRPR